MHKLYPPKGGIFCIVLILKSALLCSKKGCKYHPKVVYYIHGNHLRVVFLKSLVPPIGGGKGKTMREKQRLEEIFRLVERKNFLLDTLAALKRDNPETFGNLIIWSRLLDEIDKIDSALTKLGFYRGKRK